MFNLYFRTTALAVAGTLGLVVPDLSALSATTGALRAWNYALQIDQGGAPNRALAQIRGEGGSSLWFSCTKVTAEDEPPQVLSLIHI